MYRKLFLIALAICLLPAMLLAQDGKLRGRVSDKQTGEALIGVNVVLDGTTLGAATDANGDYVILGVPPGVYTVRVSYIGYQTLALSNIRVSANLTTTQDFQMTSTAIEMEALEIVAERPLVQRNTTNTVRMTTTEDIENLPIRGLQNIVALNAGTVQQDGVLHIRGGRANEIAYFVDGANATNPLFNSENITVIQEAIEEIQMQAGGFTAEFGGANSGVVRTTMKTGGPRMKVTVDYRTDDFVTGGDEFLGTTSLGYRNGVVTVGGPLGKKLRYFVAGQHNYQRNSSAEFIKPFSFENLVDDGLEGRVPGTPLPGPVAFQKNYLPNNSNLNNQLQGTLVYNFSSAVNLRFSGSFQYQRNPTGFGNFVGALGNMFDNTIGRNERKYTLLGLKATHLLNPTTFYEINVNYTNRNFRSYDPTFGDDWQKYADRDAWAAAGKDVSEWLNVFQGPLPYSTIFNFTFTAPNTPITSYSKNNQSSIGASGDFTTQLNKNIELKAGGRYEYWTMRLFSVGSIDNYLSYLYGSDGSLRASGGRTFNSELERRVQLANRGGISAYGYDIDGVTKINDGVNGPQHPVFASGYVQAKMEYRDLILNFGVRYERIDPKILRPDNLETPTYDKDLQYIDESTLTRTQPNDYLLPRLNFAFPVTDRTVFYAQYGKYVQMPNLNDLYRGGVRNLSRDVIPESRSLYGFFGQYVGFTAKPERTDQYELGIRQSLTDNFAFTVTAFYKDLRDQLRLDRVLADGSGSLPAGTPIVAGWLNNDFGTSKGLEMTLELRRVNRLSARINYTLSNTRGTGSDSRSTRVAVSDATISSYPTLTYNLDYNQAHRGSIIMDYRFAKGDGGKILEGLGLNAIVRFNSGHNYTQLTEPRNLGQANPWNIGVRAILDRRGANPVESINSSSTPWNFDVDLNLEKMLYFSQFNVKLYANLLNAFNTRNIINVYETTGTADDDGWLKSPLASQYIQIPGYLDFYRAINLENRWGYLLATGNDLWGPPRQIRFGIMFEFF